MLSFLSASKLTGGEHLALAFQIKFGMGEVPDIFPPRQHALIVKTALCFERMWYALTLDEYTDGDLQQLEDTMDEYVGLLNITFGPGSKYGFNLACPKLHALSHIPFWICFFGAMCILCTATFEEAHKKKVKTVASLTNHRGDTSLQMQSREVRRTGLAVLIQELPVTQVG
jgi:hypothetical protein